MNKYINKLLKLLKYPSFILLKLDSFNIVHLSDINYIKILYKERIGKNLSLSNPQTFNEKLQWLKLNDRKDIYTTMVDKYEAKKYVATIIGEEYIIPTIGIYDKFDDIDFDELPDQFVMKCTHDSGGLVIVKDKKDLDISLAKKKINKSLKRNYYYAGREWPYKNIKPRILIEEYMEDKNSSSMKDYKFFCFNGVPKIMYLSEGLENHNTASMSFYDMNFKLTDCKRKDYKLLDYSPKRPETFELMKKFASILSTGIAHLRVDFYEINGHLYFGELTFTTCAGFVPFENEEWDKKLGDLIDLSLVKKDEK